MAAAARRLQHGRPGTWQAARLQRRRPPVRATTATAALRATTAAAARRDQSTMASPAAAVGRVSDRIARPAPGQTGQPGNSATAPPRRVGTAPWRSPSGLCRHARRRSAGTAAAGHGQWRPSALRHGTGHAARAAGPAPGATATIDGPAARQRRIRQRAPAITPEAAAFRQQSRRKRRRRHNKLAPFRCTAQYRRRRAEHAWQR